MVPVANAGFNVPVLRTSPERVDTVDIRVTVTVYVEIVEPS